VNRSDQIPHLPWAVERLAVELETARRIVPLSARPESHNYECKPEDFITRKTSKCDIKHDRWGNKKCS
jgi:hypothetical protein